MRDRRLEAHAAGRDEVERAIRGGVRYLLKEQRDDGSWPEADDAARTGTTSLVTLALLTAGESPDSGPIRRALDPHLCRCGSHNRILRAVKRAARAMREGGAA